MGQNATKGSVNPHFKSPMPFGNESAWDEWDKVKIRSRIKRSPMPFGNESAWDPYYTGNHALGIESPMPFGNESAWDPPMENNDTQKTEASPMPFGNESAWDETGRYEVNAYVL